MLDTPRRGRPPGPSDPTREAVLTAALDLLLTEGVGALTPLRLHERSGVARSTIYRHWSGPDEVVDDLLDQAEHTPQPVPTGRLEADLEAAVRALVDRLEHRPVAAFLAALIEGTSDDAARLERRSRYLGSLLSGVEAAVAAARPPVPRRLRPELVDLVAGPVLVAWLRTGRAPSPRRAGRAVAHALAALELDGRTPSG